MSWGLIAVEADLQASGKARFDFSFLARSGAIML